MRTNLILRDILIYKKHEEGMVYNEKHLPLGIPVI